MMRNPWTILLYTREEGRRAYVQAALPPLAATDCFLPESAAAMVAGGDKRQSATQKTPVAEGMPEIRPGARRYIAITAGSGPTSPPFPVPVFLPHPAGEGRTRRSRSTEKKCWQRTHALCGGVARSRVVSGTCRSNGRTDGLPPA
jgi:hypothetical protein